MNAHRSPSAVMMKTLLALFLFATPAFAAPSGASLYRENCASCHGAKGAGDGPVAAKLKPKPSDLTKSRLEASAIAGVVKNGKNACPKWPSLSDEEISALADYAKSLQQ